MADKPSIIEELGHITKEAPKLVSALAEMAGAELGQTAKHAGIGTGYVGGAAGVAYTALKLFIVALGFLFAWVFEKLGLSLLLAVFLGLLLMVVLSGVLAVFLLLRGRARFSKVQAPKQTMAALSATVETVKGAVAKGTQTAFGPKAITEVKTPEVLVHVVTDPIRRRP
jgi:hypothetical protein